MTMRLVMLEQARSSVAFGVDHFLQEYPGVFLLAVGLVSAEPALTPGGLARNATQELHTVDLDDTFSMGSGERLIHSLHDHPLAGCAFFIPRTDPSPKTAGRKTECDLVIPDVSVSDRHCELRLMGGEMLVTDLSSTNGTMVNLQRLEPQVATPIEDEAILTVGRYSFQFFEAHSLYAAMQLLEQSR